MSKLIATSAIRGAHEIVAEAEALIQAAEAKHGPAAAIGFPHTAYYLPVIHAMLGLRVEKLSDCGPVLERCRALLPPVPAERHHLPYLGHTLDAGMAAVFAQEIIEATHYLNSPERYCGGEDPQAGRPWLGAAEDAIFRKRGVEFVDGTAPGFALVLGAAPTDEIAVRIAQELQEKNLYTLIVGGRPEGGEEKTFAGQLAASGLQLGWPTRLVPLGSDTSAAVFALGFACRVAMGFGGLKPGDARRILFYCKDRIFAFVLALGEVPDRWYATAAGAINFGVPTIADSNIPEILPYGVCTYEHVVSNVAHEALVAKAIEVRGLKISVTRVPVPVAYGAAFEGERVRKEDLHAEFGGGRTECVELVRMRELAEVEDGRIEVIGPDVTDVVPGGHLPLAILAEVAGRVMQEDFEPILERQIHHLINHAQGVMHIGQRDITWLRISRAAFDKGFRLADIGRILHAKYHQDFGKVFDKVQVKLITEPEGVSETMRLARAAYKQRDERVERMIDETTDVFYSCTLCQSFAPNHVCVVTPERTGLCGAYNWMDCKASHEISPTGPNRPIQKGEVLDATLGQWKGVNEFVYKASRFNVDHYNLYSLVNDPMTCCGCCECIAAVMPLCNGVMTVNREFTGMTPSGMKFSTLAGLIGGGHSTPGFLGHGKYYITQRKFISGDGGLARLVWMPKTLKEEIAERLVRRGEEIGIPNLIDLIADETVGVTEEEILPWLEEKQHPALKMDSILG
ncbi:MAG: acetyl-CoA decarbonylase/synthase complex subunit alpha/beta [Pseudomonadota bacterium]